MDVVQASEDGGHSVRSDKSRGPIASRLLFPPTTYLHPDSPDRTQHIMSDDEEMYESLSDASGSDLDMVDGTQESDSGMSVSLIALYRVPPTKLYSLSCSLSLTVTNN